MKKLSLGLLLSLVLMLTACGKDPLARFETAVEKTSALEQYKMSVAGDIGMSLPEVEGEQPKAGTENITIDMKADVDKGKTKADISYSVMGMTMNTVMYGDAEKSIMKMPLSDKYITMDIDTEGSTDVQQSQESLKKLSEEVYAEMIEKIKSDGEITLEKAELELPDGKVEVDKGIVKLKSEDVKELLLSVSEKVYADEEMAKLLEEQTGEVKTQEQRDAELAEMKAELEKVEIENFEFAVYIDSDDYIVGQDIKMDLISSENKAESLSLDLDIRTWDMNKAQNIEFPELTDENSMSFEDYIKSLEMQMPEMPQTTEGGDINIEDYLPEDFNMEDFNPEDFNLEDMNIPVENIPEGETPEVTVE